MFGKKDGFQCRLRRFAVFGSIIGLFGSNVKAFSRFIYYNKNKCNSFFKNCERVNIMAVLSNGRFGCAKWIGAGFVHVNWLAPAKPAPFFRKSFQISGKIKSAEVFFCGLGWAELYLNGQKVGDHVLEPAVSQYDRRARYVRYDVANLLKNGWNVFGVILGNGWYDCATSEVWHFDKASWRDYPKFIFELCLNDIPILFSDNTWKSLREDGPIRFNEIRNGEFYDARRELPGWAEEQFDDSGWDDATNCPWSRRYFGGTEYAALQGYTAYPRTKYPFFS